MVCAWSSALVFMVMGIAVGVAISLIVLAVLAR
jgi:hypothetical protein